MKNGQHVTASFQTQQGKVIAEETHDHHRKIPALTGIRGYAAIWVVLHHCTNIGWFHFTGSLARTDDIPFLIPGYLGVELFFILSGFILIKIYGRTGYSFESICAFAIGRMFRVLPVYWLSLLMLAIITPLMQDRWLAPEPHSLSNWLRCFLLIQSWVKVPTAWNAPGWSLSAEWLAYFGFPILAMAMSRVRSKSLLIFIAGLSIYTLAFFYHRRFLVSLNNAGSFGVERCLCEFTIGIALGRIHQLGMTGARFGSVSLFMGLVILLLPMIAERYDFLAIIAFGLMVLSAGSRSRYAHALFGNPIAHFLGEISFSIYVLHWVLLELVMRFVTAPISIVAGLVAIPFAVLPLAWVTWRWVEVPGQAAGRVVMARLRPYAGSGGR